MTTHTSEEILAMDDLYEIQEEAGHGLPIRYRMSHSEIQWARWLGNRYSSSMYILDHMDEDDILTFDAYELSKAAWEDDSGPFLPCLSNDTGLAKLVFWTYMDPDDLEDTDD